MPVSSLQADDSPPAKRCKLCQESGHSVEEGQGLSWRIPLDQDLLDTLAAIYPDWFKEKERPGAMAEARPQHNPPGPPGPAGPGAHGPHAPPSPPAPSPPKAEVDDTPLHKAMDRNKESLKVKLMLRRPYTQLVAQGIMPPLKTPPAFHEQRKQLERAKTGDMLKAKIQQRPDRQELVRQHILEADMDHVDPSLAERQRMLKKCRLADSLNDQLAHRPGPLELIQKNILHADEPIERAVKEGVIPFRATCEGQKTKPQHPHRYITMDEDSQSSGESSVLSPPGPPATPGPPGGLPGPSCAPPLASASPPAPAPTPAPAPAPAPGTPMGALLVPRRLSAGPDVLEAAAANAGIVTLALSIPAAQHAPAAPPAALVVAASPVGMLPQQQPALPRPASAVMLGPVGPVAPAPSPMSLGSSSSLSPMSSSLSSVSSPPSCSVPSPITPRPARDAQMSPAPTPASASGLGLSNGLGLAGGLANSLGLANGLGLSNGLAMSLPLQQDALRTGAPGKDKNRKKSKSKAQPKTRTIKFHEYKGPPNASKSSILSSSPVETSYELLLQQQQLLLQCQLDWLHKYPQIILPAAQKPSTNSEVPCSSSSSSLGASISVSQSQTTATTVCPVTSNGTQLGLITVTSNISSGGTGVTVNSLGSTTGTLLGVGNGSGTLVLTAQPSPSPVQSAVATVVPAPAPQTIAVALPAQQQQQAQVTLQPPLQVPQPAVEPSQQPASQPTSQLPAAIKILGKLEDMKVSDLKMELKKRNLPVSGSKPQLIERIRNADAAAAAAADSNSNTASIGSPTEASLSGQPMDVQMDVQMDASHTFAEDSLTGFSAETPSQPSPPQPSPVAPNPTAMDTTPSSVNNQQMSPVSPSSAPSPSGSAHEMDTTPVSPSPSPVTREDLIREQQRQIKELQKQVKILQSQQQLEMLRPKETTTQKPIAKPSAAATIISANGTNGLSAALLDPSKAAVKQHLQNKIQQQQQQLQVQQLQAQLQQQQLQQQQQIALQQQQQGISAKASLAAFLQQQQLHQQTSSQSNNSSNNNNNNNVINYNNLNNNNNNNNSLNNLNNNLNKKLSKTLVVQPQLQQVVQPQPPQAAAAAIVLNPFNAQGKKGLAGLAALAGITANTNHQRTNSLPNFLASMVQLAPSSTDQKMSPAQQQQQQQQQRASSVAPVTAGGEDVGDVEMKPTLLPTHRLVLTRTTTEPHILTLTTAPAAASSAASGAATIMATANGVVPVSLPDVLTFNVAPRAECKLPQYQEVVPLLKSIKQEPGGEKSSSGRQSVKSQIVDDVLDILIKSGELPPSAAQDPTTPTPTGTSAGAAPAGTADPALSGVFSETQDGANMFANVFSPDHSAVSVQCAPPSTPPPPPPPPLPHTSFAVTLPTALPLTSTASMPPNENSCSLFSGNLDYILGNNGHPTTSVNLKELGLDVETLDSMNSMDFGLLDGPLSGQNVKMEPSDFSMEAESEGVPAQPQRRQEEQERQQQHQQLAEQFLSTPSELMDISDMPEMDPDWLYCLMAPSDPSSESSAQNSSFSQTSLLPSSSSSSYIHMNGHTDIDSYDPMLSTSQDPIDLFSMDTMDSDFKVPSELGLSINWDKIDFAT